jgi:hypothetical protein
MTGATSGCGDLAELAPGELAPATSLLAELVSAAAAAEAADTGQAADAAVLLSLSG